MSNDNEKHKTPLDQLLIAAAHAIDCDIRGYFKSCPGYGKYLSKLMSDAAAELRRHEQSARKEG